MLHISPLLMLIIYPMIVPSHTVSVSVMIGVTFVGIGSHAVKESKCTSLCQWGTEYVSQLLVENIHRGVRRKQATVLLQISHLECVLWEHRLVSGFPASMGITEQIFHIFDSICLKYFVGGLFPHQPFWMTNSVS